MRGLRLLLTLLALVGATVAWTDFEFSGRMICDRSQFKYHMTVFEWDTFFDNAISGGLSTVYVPNQPHFYRATARDNNDGLWDNYFEVFIRILHNCSPDGQYKMLEVYMGEFYINNGFYRVTKDVDLRNAGVSTTQTFPFHLNAESSLE